MKELFRIETDRVSVIWSLARDKQVFPASSVSPAPPGVLVVRPLRVGLEFSSTWRAGVPSAIAADWQQKAGPRFFEQTDYSLIVKGKGTRAVAVRHRDPVIVGDLNSIENGSTVYGTINFGSNVGRSQFSILVDGAEELEVEIEVFPSKLDYTSDYNQITAAIQEILSGLVLEYLRSTFRLGKPAHTGRPSTLEWAVLLKQFVSKLEQALSYISQHPHWGLLRREQQVRAERVKKVDEGVRRAVVRGRGTGRLLQLSAELKVREHLSEKRASPSLDTPEHRWLAQNVHWLGRRLAAIRRHESAVNEQMVRQSVILGEIRELEARLARLSQIPVLQEADGLPPANFASLKLISAPGYREAYSAVLVLRLGLRLVGGPTQLSLKDLATLYEYWCYLMVLQSCSRQLKMPVPVRQLIREEHNGLRVLLQKGKRATVKFDSPGERSVSITYNPQFHNSLITQQPDILLSLYDLSWPSSHIILDAKYRIDASPSTVQQYGLSGPPADAINVLHRYRDAITEPAAPNELRPKRMIVEAVALYPNREEEGTFQKTRLWRSLIDNGIGAIPVLPEGTACFETYLRSVLMRGGWTTAELAVPQNSTEHAADLRRAAATPVMIGVLKSGMEAQHLAWIAEQRTYYTALTRSQKRQYEVDTLLLYSPAALRQPGAVTHKARVDSVEVVPRSEIRTPWDASRRDDELQVVYRLGPLIPLTTAIENVGGVRVSQPRWTSRLGADRAHTLDELILETEPEWKLYEDLNASGVPFKVRAGRVDLVSAEDPQGRAWFVMSKHKVQYRGMAGFLIRTDTSPDRFFASRHSLVALLAGMYQL